MNYPKLTTTKLYYRKWSYKIKCYCPGSWMIKRGGVDWARSQCSTKPGDLTALNRRIDPVKLLEFINDVDQFLDKDIFVRTEGSGFSIYCNDYPLFTTICRKMSHWIKAVYEPSNDAEHQFMQDNGHKKVLCNHLPFDRYQYRVYLKEQINLETRERLWTWINKYDGQIRIPTRVANWLKGIKSWATNPSFYAENSAMISMILLFLGDRVSKVEEFVPRSMINTQSKETTCPA